MHSVLETPIFTRRADVLLPRQERFDLISLLASKPLAGDEIPGLGGVRKLRFAGGGRGKRGAFRVVYYVLNQGLPIYALLIYGKNEQADLTPAQRKAMLDLVSELKAVHRGGERMTEERG